MPAGFYSGTDWEQTSGSQVNRYFEQADLWPQGLTSEIDGGDKDVLAVASSTSPEFHPVLAIGERAFRPKNMTGVIVKYEGASKVLMNVAHGFAVRQYVSNILTYSGGAANTWDGSVDAGQPVYVDDSGPLTAGVTLSLAMTNESGSLNPIAGYIFYAQDDYDDSAFGGLNSAGLPITHSSTATVEFLACVLLTPYSAW